MAKPWEGEGNGAVMSLELARRLRRDMTEAEKVMWRLLRSRQLAGFKFRRQQPIGRYIVDFVCFSHRLVVEIDGGQHATMTRSDNLRSQILLRDGFVVLRFWNNDVLDNRDAVGARIVEVLSECTPHPPANAGPSLSHKGRGAGRRLSANLQNAG